MKSPINRLRRPLQALLFFAILPIQPQPVAANTTIFTEDWEILPTGSVIAGTGDLYSLGKGFYNNSTQNTLWNTTLGRLQFFKGGLSGNTTGDHEFTYAGLNSGSTSYTAFTNNFAWDRVEVQFGNQLINTNSSALYTKALTLGGGIPQVSTFTGSMAIYYDFADARNAYLGGGTYQFGSGSGFVAPIGAVAYWAVNASSTWGIDSDWSTNKVPSFAGIEANFGPGVSGTGNPFSGPHTVTLDGVRTVGKLVFSDTNSFTVASGAGGSLVLNDILQASQITVTTGTHAISAPVALTAHGATVDVAGGGMLSISNTVIGASGLTKSNLGTLELTGSNTYTGTTSVLGGTLAFDVSETLIGGLNIATSGTAVLTAHTGGAANVKVLDVSALSIAGVTPFSGEGGGAWDKNGSGLASAAPVPEPGTIGLLAAGAIVGAILRHRNRKSTIR